MTEEPKHYLNMEFDDEIATISSDCDGGDLFSSIDVVFQLMKKFLDDNIKEEDDKKEKYKDTVDKIIKLLNNEFSDKTEE